MNFYFSGQGTEGFFWLHDMKLRYENVVKLIIDSANNQISKITKTVSLQNKNVSDDLKYDSAWYLNWYINANHTFTCKDKTENWLINEMKCKEINNRDDDYTKDGGGDIIR